MRDRRGDESMRPCLNYSPRTRTSAAAWELRDELSRLAARGRRDAGEVAGVMVFVHEHLLFPPRCGVAVPGREARRSRPPCTGLGGTPTRYLYLTASKSRARRVLSSQIRPCPCALVRPLGRTWRDTARLSRDGCREGSLHKGSRTPRARTRTSSQHSRDAADATARCPRSSAAPSRRPPRRPEEATLATIQAMERAREERAADGGAEGPEGARKAE